LIYIDSRPGFLPYRCATMHTLVERSTQQVGKNLAAGRHRRENREKFKT
jgi:hypothetical protein